MSTKQKWFVGIAAIVIVILGFFAIYSKHIYFRSPIIFLPQPQQNVSVDRGEQLFDQGSISSFSSVKEVAGGTVTNAMSYESAYRQYQGRIIQLDQNCRAQPLTILVPQKSVIMIGNDSQWQRSIAVGSRLYNIAPYDYILASFNIAGTFPINCDSVKSVAIVSVQ